VTGTPSVRGCVCVEVKKTAEPVIFTGWRGEIWLEIVSLRWDGISPKAQNTPKYQKYLIFYAKKFSYGALSAAYYPRIGAQQRSQEQAPW
jgi:hypothetical protein